MATENTVLNLYQCMATNNGTDGLRADNNGSGFTIARVVNSSISDNLKLGLRNFGNTATFESLGKNLVRGNAGGDTSGTITVITPK